MTEDEWLQTGNRGVDQRRGGCQSAAESVGRPSERRYLGSISRPEEGSCHESLVARFRGDGRSPKAPLIIRLDVSLAENGSAEASVPEISLKPKRNTASTKAALMTRPPAGALAER